jgi:hypothetical protein
MFILCPGSLSFNNFCDNFFHYFISIRNYSDLDIPYHLICQEFFVENRAEFAVLAKDLTDCIFIMRDSGRAGRRCTRIMLRVHYIDDRTVWWDSKR